MYIDRSPRLPTPGNRRDIRRRVDRGRSKSLKREEKEERKRQALYPQFFNFYPCEQGRDCLVVEGLALAWEEIACMSWGRLALGAQDKDVKPDGDILSGMLAVAEAPVPVTTLCRLGPAPQPSLDHRSTTPDAEKTQ